MTRFFLWSAAFVMGLIGTVGFIIGAMFFIMYTLFDPVTVKSFLIWVICWGIAVVCVMWSREFSDECK